jgi:FkbM family methyltransferase
VLYKDVINETHIIKIKNDYAYKLKKQLGSAVWAYLKRDSNSKYLSLLPFHISELKPHLEKQFKSDMNWNNYGTCWSLDHIKPISSFNIVDENCDDFRECWSFNNLQPLYVSENAKKYKVRTYTLNHLFESGLVEQIDFLKVDIEGAEHLAFGGISDENLMKVKNIAMEYHHGHFNYDEELRNNFITKMNNLGFNSYMMFMGNNNELQMIYFWR